MPLTLTIPGIWPVVTRPTYGCGGITVRLHYIRGRLVGRRVGRNSLYSQDLDDVLLQIRGLLTYRATTDRRKHDRLNIAYLATPVDSRIDAPILNTLQQLHAVAETLFYGDLVFGEIQHVERFPVNHTV